MENGENNISFDEKPKKSKKVLIIIIIILLIIAGICGYLYLNGFFDKNEKEEPKQVEKKEKEEVKEVTVKTIEGKEFKSDKYITDEDDETKIPVTSENAKVIASSYPEYLYFDETLKIYDRLSGLVFDFGTKVNDVKHFDSEKIFSYLDNGLNVVDYNKYEKSINVYTLKESDYGLSTSAEYSDVYVLLNKGDKYKLLDKDNLKTIEVEIDKNYTNAYFYGDKDKLYGTIYYNSNDSDNTDYCFYNIEKKTKLYDKKYTNMEAVGKGLLSADITTSKSHAGYLLSTEEEKVIIKDETVSSFEVDGNFAYGIMYAVDDMAPIRIYNLDGKMISDFVDYNVVLNEKDNIYIGKNKSIIKYDKSGNKLAETGSYSKILHIFKAKDKNYVVAVNSKNKIIITDIEGTFTKELGNYKKGMIYHYPMSGWYDAEELKGTNDEGKPSGIYMIFEYSNETGVEYYYNPTTGETKSYKLATVEANYAKPVLYLYPKKETKVKVTFDNPNNLTTTYPKYNNSWIVTAKPNGDLYDQNGNYYYGLYWEEKKNHLVDFKTGFYVEKDNAIKFLEEKLSLIGLNPRERNEFIMYWLPILEKNEKSLVYFELTEERNSNSKINISPRPDSLLRVAIHVKKVDKKTNIKEEKLTKFNRTGFAAVEWGGINYD